MHARQGGIALVVGLIMLLLMTMLAISAFRMGSVQAVVVSNAQHRNQGLAAAQAAIDTVVNSSNFTVNPGAAITNTNCAGGGGANVLCVASNGDSVNDFTVTLTPQPFCVMAAVIPAAQLDLSSGANAPDLGCLSGPQQGEFAVSGAVGGNSLCATSTWEIGARAADSSTNTIVNLTQGIGQRILTAQMTSYCPS